MPAPSAVTGLTLTQPSPEVPEITLAWSHATPASVSRWQLSYRRIGQTAFIPWRIYERDAIGSGGNYSVNVPSPTGVEWFVAALSTKGEASTLTGKQFTAKALGTWLFPSRNGLIAASLRVGLGGGVTRRRAIESTIYDAPYRAKKVVGMGEIHDWDGDIAALFLPFTLNGVSLKGRDFEDRLEQLLKTQQNYQVTLVMPRRMLHAVALVENFEISEDQESQDYPPGTLSFIEV